MSIHLSNKFVWLGFDSINNAINRKAFYESHRVGQAFFYEGFKVTSAFLLFLMRLHLRFVACGSPVTSFPPRLPSERLTVAPFSPSRPKGSLKGGTPVPQVNPQENHPNQDYFSPRFCSSRTTTNPAAQAAKKAKRTLSCRR